MRIFLGVGHGAGDPGAIAKYDGLSYTESDHIELVLARAKDILARQNVDIGYVPLDLKLATQRIPWINKNIMNDKLLIELHMNSGGEKRKGAMMFYYGGSSTSQVLAEKLLDVYVKSTGQTSEGVKPDTASRFGRLGIIRDTSPTALLLELGYITNKEEFELMKVKAALGVVNVVLSYLNKPLLESYGSEKEKQTVSTFAETAVMKAVNKKGVNGQSIIGDFSRPHDEVTLSQISHAFFKLGLLQSPDGVLSLERFAVALDRAKLL